MKFNLLDKIELLTDTRIVAVKQVSLAEEYLADHFPTFPVLPGVLMLEAATQAAGWLLHHRNHFAQSMVVLKEARNVKYGNFVAPGNLLRLDVELTRETPTGAIFKVAGSVPNSQSPAISAKIELAAFDLGTKQPELAPLDEKLREHNKARWAVLTASAAPALQVTSDQ